MFLFNLLVFIRPKMAKCPDSRPRIGSDCKYHEKKSCSYGELCNRGNKKGSYGERLFNKKKKPYKVYRCDEGQWTKMCRKKSCQEISNCTESEKYYNKTKV